MTTCKKCQRKYNYSRKSGHRKTICNSCTTNYRRFNLKEKCVKYLGGKCQFCQYNKCINALSFHHINPNTKSFEVSGSHCKSWKLMQQELDKCILLCCNCHMELHYAKNSLAQDCHNDSNNSDESSESY